MYHKPTERVLNILTYLSRNTQGATLTNLASDLDIPKSTISPILQEMVYQNYLYLNPDLNTYHIGLTTHAVASSYNEIKELIPFIKSEMTKITEKTTEICQMGVLEGPNVLYLLKEEPQKKLEIQIISYVGKRIPAYATALGKALLAGISLDELKNLYPTGLIAQTEKTITDFKMLKNQLDSFSKENSISYEEEEISPHLCCYAIAINLPKQKKFALSVSLPIFRTNQAKRDLVKKLLKNAKNEIEKKYISMISN